MPLFLQEPCQVSAAANNGTLLRGVGGFNPCARKVFPFTRKNIHGTDFSRCHHASGLSVPRVGRSRTRNHRNPMKENLLILDDDLSFAAHAATTAREAGFEVHPALTLGEALSAAEHRSFDC